MKLSEGSGVDMSYNGPPVRLYRPPSKGAVPYSDWKDEALCDGMDPDLFELGDPDEVSQEDQEELIAWGLQVCAGCPVRAACRNSSSELDRYWTTRGGQPPEGLFQDSVEPPYLMKRYVNGFEAGMGPKRKPQKKCKNGHEDWVTRRDGKRRCLTCYKAAERKRWGGEK